MTPVLRHSRCAVVAAVLGLSMLGAPALANDAEDVPDKGLTEHTSEYVRDYLSDPRRAGALTGSLLGAALTVHPAGTVIGSLVGFFIGKQSMFDEDKARAQQRLVTASRRDIIPLDGTGQAVPTLSFANPKAITFSEVAPTRPAASTAFLPTRAAPAGSVAVLPVTPAPHRLLREQVAEICGGDMRPADPRLGALCFYSEAASAVPAPNMPPPVALSTTPGPRSVLREQIAEICGGGMRPADPRLDALCFYSRNN